MIEIKTLSFTEQDIIDCQDISILLNYEIELLKLMSHMKAAIDNFKDLKEKGTPVPYETYSKNIRFKTLLGILHSTIKNRISGLNKDNPKVAVRHFGSFFIGVAQKELDNDVFQKIKEKAEVLYSNQID